MDSTVLVTVRYHDSGMEHRVTTRPQVVMLLYQIIGASRMCDTCDMLYLRDHSHGREWNTVVTRDATKKVATSS